MEFKIFSNKTPNAIGVYPTGDVWEVVVYSEDGELAEGYEDIEFYETKAEAISEARKVFNNEGTARSLSVQNWNPKSKNYNIKTLRVR
jgi:hypothetical protein